MAHDSAHPLLEDKRWLMQPHSHTRRSQFPIRDALPQGSWARFRANGFESVKDQPVAVLFDLVKPIWLIRNFGPAGRNAERMRTYALVPSGKWLEFGVAHSRVKMKVSFQAARSIG